MNTPASSSYHRAYIVAAFIAGAALTLSIKQFYPDLEARFRGNTAPSKQDTEKSSSNAVEEKDGRQSLKRDVKDGIEGCIGNTPLIRIVSL